MIGPLGRLGAAATLGQHCPQMTQRPGKVSRHFGFRGSVLLAVDRVGRCVILILIPVLPEAAPPLPLALAAAQVAPAGAPGAAAAAADGASVVAAYLEPDGAHPVKTSNLVVYRVTLVVVQLG